MSAKNIVTKKLAGLLGAVLCAGLFIIPGAKAQEPVRIASNIVFDETWIKHARGDQREFIATLGNQKRPISFQVVPYNRFPEVMGNNQTDCVFASKIDDFEDSFAAQSRIRFELRLFNRIGVELKALPLIEIGILANLPRPKVPLDAEILWHDLRNLEQAVGLLDAGRLDAIIGDDTNIRIYGKVGIEQADLPPVIVVNLKLICRDTEPLREFVSDFDSSMGVSSSLDFLPKDGRYRSENVW